VTAIAPTGQIVICRSLDEGDADGIAELHRRIYMPEYGMNDEFVSRVAAGVVSAVATGWPRSGGGVWLVDHEQRLAGSLALTDEGDGCARLRWFVLDPALRGRGLGRLLVSELLARAREQCFERIELETFSELTAAARIYRDAGFRLIWERERTDWGAPIVYQHYCLELD
jgi:ribosomal protein S18 acetylase RimI-like enzyme